MRILACVNSGGCLNIEAINVELEHFFGDRVLGNIEVKRPDAVAALRHPFPSITDDEEPAAIRTTPAPPTMEAFEDQMLLALLF